MSQAKRDRGCRTSDIEYRNGALHFVMPGFVEEIAEPNHSDRLTSEVHRESR